MLGDASAINGYAIEASDGRLRTVSDLLTIALTHMAINFMAVVMYVINIWLRASGPTNLGPSLSAPVVLSIIGVELLFVSGWLGGQMVHVYGVGVEGRE